jgi:hypothetical protein
MGSETTNSSMCGSGRLPLTSSAPSSVWRWFSYTISVINYCHKIDSNGKARSWCWLAQQTPKKRRLTKETRRKKTGNAKRHILLRYTSHEECSEIQARKTYKIVLSISPNCSSFRGGQLQPGGTIAQSNPQTLRSPEASTTMKHSSYLQGFRSLDLHMQTR